MRTKSKVLRVRPPADFDEVKRRFIRQNRDLAKSNSTHSLKIRSLELEVSRLLSENLDLRNQVLHLQNELYMTQTRTAQNAASKVKEELRAKIEELNAIVNGINEMEGVPLPDELMGKRPTEGIWRERQPLRELMGDSQMPTITEDKLYPRRTLGADEIRAIRLSNQDSNESPDIGSPPIARFDFVDPIKQASPSPVKDDHPVADENILPANLAINLETRRKRRDGSSRIEIRRHSILPPQSPAKSEGEQPASTLLRTGAKRKLADRENDKPIKPPSQGDFSFSRKVVGEEVRSAGQKLAASAQAEESPPASPKAARKVLGDKSVNMSPRKVTLDQQKPDKAGLDKPISLKSSEDQGAAAGRRRRVSAIPLPSPPRQDIVETVELEPLPRKASPFHADIDPKTPALPDFFSPTPSEPSTKPDKRGDTPPPSDLSTLSITTDGGDVRPSRRTRAPVNYTEPSLVNKMRRPDKKLVDAISGLQDPRRAMSVSTTKRTSRTAPPTSEPKTVSIKQEPVEDEGAWKDVPDAVPSPLQRKANAVDQSQSRDEQKAAKSRTETPTESNTAGSDDATSATVASTDKPARTRSLSTQHRSFTDSSIDSKAKRLEDLDIYEFKESSSPAEAPGLLSTKDKPTGAPRARAHQRRHSTAVKNGGTVGLGGRLESGIAAEDGGGTLGDETGAAVHVRRRRSMMV